MNVVFEMPDGQNWPRVVNVECEHIPRQGETVALPVSPTTRQIFVVKRVHWSVEGNTMQECYITVIC